jgi:uncharacterized cupin superfamily protein
MKTAVEWLYEQMPKKIQPHYKRQLEQAKEMEKEQMLKTFTESRTISVECAVWNCQGNERKWESFEQCYNETFKQQEQ